VQYDVPSHPEDPNFSMEESSPVGYPPSAFMLGTHPMAGGLPPSMFQMPTNASMQPPPGYIPPSFGQSSMPNPSNMPYPYGDPSGGAHAFLNSSVANISLMGAGSNANLNVPVYSQEPPRRQSAPDTNVPHVSRTGRGRGRGGGGGSGRGRGSGSGH
jgi:hypothetical protein